MCIDYYNNNIIIILNITFYWQLMTTATILFFQLSQIGVSVYIQDYMDVQYRWACHHIITHHHINDLGTDGPGGQFMLYAQT